MKHGRSALLLVAGYLRAETRRMALSGVQQPHFAPVTGRNDEKGG